MKASVARAVAWFCERLGAHVRGRCGCLVCDTAERDARRAIGMPARHPERITRDLLGGQEERGEFKPGPAADAGPVKPGGNNVDLEIEMAKMVRNSALHSTAAALLTHQFALLREAVAGHVIQ